MGLLPSFQRLVWGLGWGAAGPPGLLAAAHPPSPKPVSAQLRAVSVGAVKGRSRSSVQSQAKSSQLGWLAETFFPTHLHRERGPLIDRWRGYEPSI